MKKDDRDRLAMMLAEETTKARKLEIIFGPWWRHYAVPYEFPATLYTEQSMCPYCNGSLGKFAFLTTAPAENSESAHLDHMDPLSRGGEDSIRNVVFVCRNCNLGKGRRLFVDWLEMLDPNKRVRARQIYQEKHGHAPETFQPGAKHPRLTSLRYELSFDENVLRKLFQRPVVSGPPTRA